MCAILFPAQLGPNSSCKQLLNKKDKLFVRQKECAIIERKIGFYIGIDGTQVLMVSNGKLQLDVT